MSIEKNKTRKEKLAHYGINLSSMLLDCDEKPELPEQEFVTTLVNMLQAYDQSKQCPCSECIENFVVRAKRLYRYAK